MAYDFPTSPSVGQEFAQAGVTYVYNGQGWLRKGGVGEDYVRKTGDTMSGDLNIVTTSFAVIRLDKAVGGFANIIQGKMNNKLRWDMRFGNTGPESGANSGSEFQLVSYDDAGTFLNAPITVSRATGAMTLPSSVPSTSPTTGALTVAGGVGIGGALNISGDLKVVPASGNARLWLNNPGANNSSVVIGQKSGNVRWIGYFGDDVPESGGDTGSNFKLQKYNDAGSGIDALTINRSTSAVTLLSAVPSTSTTTGALTVAGGVGIGGKLIVGAGATVFGAINTNSPITIDDGTRIINLNPAYAGTTPTVQVQTNHPLWFATNNTAWMKLNAVGELRIETTTASTSPTTGALQVVGGVGIGGALNVANGASIVGMNALAAGNPAALKLSYHVPSGYHGLAIRNSTDAGYSILFESAAGATVGGITTTATQTVYNTSSDERLKEDLKPFDGGKIIDEIEVHDFKWKSSQKRDIGVIAQRVEKVYPSAVTHIEDNWGIDYSKFVPLLLQELKSVRIRLKQLEEK